MLISLRRVYIVFLFVLLSAQGYSQSGMYDVRFLVSNVDAANMKLYIDIEVRAEAAGSEFHLADQNYRFSFNRDALENPQLAGELDISGLVQQTSPATTSLYSPHTLLGSLDTIVSYNLELSGGDGYYLDANDYVGIGTVSFDIVDINVPLCLEWHSLAVDFPYVFISEQLNNALEQVPEGSILDYCQDLSDAFINATPTATDDTDTTLEEQAVTVCLLGNDNDAETVLDTASISLISTPPASEGTVVVNGDGCITFTPAQDFNGTVTPIEYEVCDIGILIPSYQGDTNGAGIPSPDPGDPDIQTMVPECTTAFINLTVDPVNDMPVAVDDSNNTLEDTPLNGTTTLVNDSDVDGDNLIVNTTPVTPPSNGTLVLNPDGTYTYTPNTNFNGADSFTYEVCDDGSPSLCTTATVNITVDSVNDTPVALDDSGTTPEDTPLSGTTTLVNDSDVENHNLTVNTTPVTPPSNGTLVLNPDGTYTYTPNANFNGADSFTYEVCDDGSPIECTTATVNITIDSVNDTPVALDDSGTTPEDTSLNGTTVLVNDSDVETVTLVINTTPITAPSNGTVVINPDGTYTYTPNSNFNGTDSFVYEVCDDASPALCTTATVNITVDSVNDTPVATNDIGFATEDTPLNGSTTLSNDNDIENGTLTVNTTPVTTPANGTVVINPDGTYTYTPNANFNGADSFEYEVCDDGSPIECTTAIVNIAVSPVNDAPLAVDDSETTQEDMPITGTTTLINDSDIEGNNLSVSTTPATAPANGTVVINPDGTYTYTPNADFNGADSFEYEVCDDGSPSLCSTALVNITVDPVNDAPIAIDDTSNAPEDTPLNGTTVLNNDTDLENDDLVVNTTPITPPTNGTVVINSDGTYTYTPNADFNGTDSFVYEVCDVPSVTFTGQVNTAEDDAEELTTGGVIENSSGDLDLMDDSGTVNSAVGIRITNINIPQNAVITNAYLEFVADENNSQATSLTISAEAIGDAAPISTAPFAISSKMKTSSASWPNIPAWTTGSTYASNDISTVVQEIVDRADWQSGNAMTLIIEGIGTRTAETFEGGTAVAPKLVVDYELPSESLCDQATVTINVDSTNDTPVALDDNSATPEDTPLNGATILTNDSDADLNNLIVNTTPVTAPVNGTLLLNSDGTYTYNPNTNFNGTDSFVYEVCDDGIPSLCTTATVNITIDPVNDAPVALDDSDTTNEDTPLNGSTTLVNDSDIEGNNLLVTTTPVTAPLNGTLVLNSDGTYTYTPNQDFNGTDSFEYEVCDDGLPSLCTTAIVNINIASANDSPVALDDSSTILEDTPLNGSTVLMNDSDVDNDNLIINTTPATPPANGTVVINPDGTYTYTPSSDFNGMDSFTYQICDDGLPSLCTTAVVNITIDPVNDSPVANVDINSTQEDTPVNGSTVLVNDTDVDGDNLTVNTTPVTAPVNGTVVINPDGSYIYTPAPGYSGTDSFEYEVCDDGSPSLCSTGMVNLSIGAVNDPPIALADNSSTSEDSPLNGTTLLGNDSDLDGDNLTVTTTPVTSPVNGTLVLNSDGTYTYTPNPDFNGADSFVYEVCDDGSPTLCSTAQVDITIAPVNDNPVAVGDVNTTQEDSPLNGTTVLNNDTDIDGDNLTVTTTPVTVPVNGTLVLNPDGTYTYNPDSGFNGLDGFEYEVCDDGTPSLCSTASVNISVGAVNDPPIALTDNSSTPEDTPLNGATLLGNDIDLDGDNLSVTTTPITAPANGTLVLNTDGTYIYTPNPDFNGPDSFEYEVCDDGSPSLCSVATVNITIDPVNDPPVAIDDAETTDEDVLLLADVSPNDTDIDGGSPTFILLTGTSNGTLTFNADGTFTYLPNNDFSGTDSFDYSVLDGAGGSDQATVNITVNPVNDAPVATDDTDTTPEETLLSSSVGGNDTDIDGGTPTYNIILGTPNGTLTFNADGTFTYLPNTNFNGTDVFIYQINDGNGGTDQATVSITVTPVNDAPIANDDTALTPEETLLVSSVEPNDTDIDGDATTFVIVTGTSNGTLTFNGDGSYTYLPDPDFNGTDSFTYQISDGNGGTDIATVNITVSPVNDMPIALIDVVTLPQDDPFVIDVTSNDTDIEDGTLDPCSVTIATPPSFGTISFGPAPACELIYTPDPGFLGADSFEYEVCDSDGACANAIVDVEVIEACVDVQLSVWLEGALSDLNNGYLNSMRTDLNTARNLLPGQVSGTPAGQPYNVAPWNYMGTEGTGWTGSEYVAIENANGGRLIVDWILVSFRTGTDAASTILRAAALVLEDGTVVFPEECALNISLPFPLYVVIEHRHHMGVMSPSPVNIVNGQMVYDFRNGLAYPDPNPGFSQKEVLPGMFAMYSGDGDQLPDIISYDINGQDKIIWETDNGIFSQYRASDYNMDGDINGGDKIIWEQNNGISSSVPK